jgi:transcriptional regulator with XRE-family HTH domain
MTFHHTDQVTELIASNSESLTGALGGNVRRRRELAGMSLGQLAALSNTAKGTVSQIENGQANPTIETIDAIAKALGCAAADLVVIVTDPMVVYCPATTKRERVGAVDGKLLQRFAPTGPVELYEISLRKAQRRLSTPHAIGVYEHLWVASGRVELGPVTAPFVLTAGDYVCFQGWQEHIYRALDGPVQLLLMLSYVRSQMDGTILRHIE